MLGTDSEIKEMAVYGVILRTHKLTPFTYSDRMTRVTPGLSDPSGGNVPRPEAKNKEEERKKKEERKKEERIKKKERKKKEERRKKEGKKNKEEERR